MSKYSQSTLKLIKNKIKEGNLQDAVEAAQDSGKYSEDEAKSFILQNESEFKNGRTKKGSDN
jgi:predicted RNA-binding protein